MNGNKRKKRLDARIARYEAMLEKANSSMSPSFEQIKKGSKRPGSLNK